MTGRLCGWYGAVLAAVVAGGCKSDPTASLAGKPAQVSMIPNPLFLNEAGVTGNITVRVLDQSLSALPGSVTAVATVPSVATVAPANVSPDPTNTTTIFSVTSGVPGAGYVKFSGQGLTDSARVNVVPVAFTGALSSATKKGGDTLTIHSTPLLKFDPAKVSVGFPGGDAGQTGDSGTIVFAAAESVRVLVPFGKAGPLTIGGVTMTYVPKVELSLPTSATFTQTGDLWVADSSWQTAPNLTGLLPASGKSVQLIVTLPARNNASVCPEVALSFGSSGPCMIFAFTLADTATYNFATAWFSGDGAGGNPDIDIYACSDSTVANFGSACFEDGGAGATSAEPQATGNHKYPAGTHYFVAEYFASCDNTPAKCLSSGLTTNYYVTISRP